MFNFQINFSYPWLLLLFIPVVALALFLYFRIAKKYRRTRNRITSLVLYLVIMFLCVTVLAGMSFSYDIYNSENEVILLVDASYSTEEEQAKKDGFIQSVLNTADPNVYKIGIVTFGYDQNYAVPLTNDFSDVYAAYKSASLPDTSATDIAAALTYADSLFTKPEAAKIVLISDGIETDDSALTVIRTIAAKGVRVDTYCCSTLTAEREVQIIGAEVPDYNVSVNEKFTVSLKLQNNYPETTTVTVRLVDNGNSETEIETTADLVAGISTVTMDFSFAEADMHCLNFIVETEYDSVSKNNSYYTYMYLAPHDQILIIECFSGESEQLAEMLKEQGFVPTVKNVTDEDFPATLDDLRKYDEVILNNIAQDDLTEDFTKVLNEYVYNVGGGLFTVGGSEPDDIETAHAYDRDDMRGTLLQQMLPVQAIDYTPPLGLAIVIDVSGSMGSRIDTAKNSAVSIVKDETCLSERDYCAVLTLSNSYSEEVRPIPMTRQDEILDAIYGVGGTGGTNFSPAIQRASQDLLALYNAGSIQKMHVVIITDGGAFDYDEYLEWVKYYYNLGVTFSFIAVESSEQYMEQMRTAAKEGGGQAILCTASDMTIKLKDDLRVPEIKDVVYGEFTPKIDQNSSFGNVISQEEMPQLYGFYGTKARSSAEVILSGEYGVPIYAQWRYGNGMVGSFMCDLKSSAWSSAFMASPSGQKFVTAVVNKLFPVGSIRSNDFSVVLREDNYKTQVSIYPKTDLEEDERVVLSVENLVKSNSDITVVAPSASDGYTRATIVAKDAGVYAITVQRYRGEIPIGDPYTVYKTFSYSEEYNMFQTVDGNALMQELATVGNGESAELDNADAIKVFEGFITSLQRDYDPRFLFIILALILFLLDIAVRKFKFKWPHELVREYREKRRKG